MSLLLLFPAGAPADESKSGDDTGSGADDASLAASLSGSETASGVDDASLAAALSDAETGAGVDAADLAVSVSGSETGAGADDAALAAADSGSDTGTGSDDASLAAALTDADTGAGTDDATLDAPGGPDADTGSGADAGDLAVDLTGSDTGVGADDGAMDPGVDTEPDDSESGSGADDATLSVAVADVEGGSPGGLLLALSVGPTTSATDEGAGADAADLAVALEGADTGVGTDASALDKPESGTESGEGGEHGYVTRFGAAEPDEGSPYATLAASGPEAPIARIKYDNIDITADVIVTGSRFTSSSNGRPGMCLIRVRDDGHVYDFVQGKPLTLDIAGVRGWTGYVATVRRGFFTMSAKAPDDRERYFDIIGVDLNILFHKRVLYNKVDGAETQLTTFPAGTDDSEVLLAYMADHLDLSSDGLGTSLIETTGSPAVDTEISGAAGWKWDDLMQMLVRNTGALYYIDPDKEVVLTDVDTPNAPFGIRDVVTTLEEVPGTGFLHEDDFDRAVLGPDYTDFGSPLTIVDGELHTDAESDGYVVWSAVTIPAQAAVRLEFDVLVPSASSYFYADVYWGNSSYVGLELLFGELELYFLLEGFSFGAVSPGYYRVKTEIGGTAGSAIRAKVWPRGSDEPSSWNIDTTRSDNQTAGSPEISLYGYDGTHARLDNLRIESQDYTPPSTAIVPIEDVVGCRELEVDFGGEGLKNDYLAWGAGQGSNLPVFSRVDDDASIAEHGLWQAATVAMSVWRQATINRIARSHVYGSPQNKRGGKDDAVAVRCAIFEPGLRVGMKVPFQSDVFGFDDVLPVRELAITFPSPTAARYDLILSHEIDSPWSTIEYWWPDTNIPDWAIPGWNIPPINLPDLPQLPGFDPCADHRCSYDYFGRPDQSAWGTADDGEAWTPGDVTTVALLGSKVDNAEGVLCELPEETAGPSVFIVRSGSFARDICEGDSILLKFRSDHHFNHTEDLLHEQSPGLFVGPLWNDPTESHNHAYMSIGGFLSGVGFPPGVLFSTDAATGYLYVQQQGTIYYHEPYQFGFSANVEYAIRIYYSPTTVKARIWPTVESEPTIWHVEEDIATPGAAASGSASVGFFRRTDATVTSPALRVNVTSFEAFAGTVGDTMGLFGEGGMCGDDFDEDSTEGWPGWTHEVSGAGDPDLTQMYVSGGYGICEAAINEYVSFMSYQNAELTRPVESLTRFVVRWTEDARSWEFYSQFDSEGGPMASSSFAWMFVIPTVVSGGGGGPRTYQPWIRIDTSDVGSDDMVKSSIEITAPDPNTPVEWDLWVRFRVEDDRAMAKVWENGDSEPGTWDLEAEDPGFEFTEAFATHGLWTITTAYDTINRESIKIAEHHIVEGCVGGGGSPCGDADPGEYADPPRSGDTSTTLEEVDPPDGEDPDSTYFIVPHYFYDRSERVYLNGRFLRPGVDYATHPDLRLIEIFDTVTINPGDAVYVSYNINLPVEVN